MIAYMFVLQALLANAYPLGETPFAYLMTKRGSKVWGEFEFVLLGIAFRGSEEREYPKLGDDAFRGSCITLHDYIFY